MAKRFTDTEKWSHAWFRKLSPKMKCAWIYLCDKCDHAGIWTSDFESLSFHVGEDVTEKELLEVFAEKITRIKSDKFLLQAFIDFQYGPLNPVNRVHQSVISRLEKEGLKDLKKDLISPLKWAKDKDKDKDKEKDKEPDWNFEAETCLQAVRLHSSDYEALRWLGPGRESYVTHLGGVKFLRTFKPEDSWAPKRLAGLIKNSWQMLNAKKESA